MSNFKEIENLIAARLKETLAELSPKPRIFKGRDITKIQDGGSQGDLAVFVTYNGIAAVNELSAVTPHKAKLTQEYLVWVAAISKKDHFNDDGTKELADDVLEAVIGSLIGAVLKKGIQPLHLVASGLGPVYSRGYGYFPLTFHHSKTVELKRG